MAVAWETRADWRGAIGYIIFSSPLPLAETIRLLTPGPAGEIRPTNASLCDPEAQPFRAYSGLAVESAYRRHGPAGITHTVHAQAGILADKDSIAQGLRYVTDSGWPAAHYHSSWGCQGHVSRR